MICARAFPASSCNTSRSSPKRRVSAADFASYARGLERTDPEILTMLDQAGVVQTMISGFDERSTCGETFVSNEAVAAVAARHADRFIPFAGADIMAGAEPLAAFERWVVEAGFRGLSLRPFMIGEPANHPAYTPYYEKCQELGVPVSIHTSANWTRSRSSQLGHPQFIDEIACRHPDLTIIMSHAGYPWVLEACLIAWKHPNVYLELGAHRPRYFTRGTAWDALMRFGQSTIVDKVLFGSGAFLINRPQTELCDEMRALPLPGSVLEAWMWRNAARVLDLESPLPAEPAASTFGGAQQQR